jgi:hypothetical protein
MHAQLADLWDSLRLVDQADQHHGHCRHLDSLCRAGHALGYSHGGYVGGLEKHAFLIVRKGAHNRAIEAIRPKNTTTPDLDLDMLQILLLGGVFKQNFASAVPLYRPALPLRIAMPCG